MNLPAIIVTIFYAIIIAVMSANVGRFMELNRIINKDSKEAIKHVKAYIN